MPERRLQHHRLLPGTVVAGKYIVESELGEGGFATVYAARHATVSSLRAAIKVLHPEHLDSGTNRRRFRREAELAAALQSRFIVRVLDAGELQDGRPFIAMEFVDGTPLDALLKKCGRLAPWDAARFIEGILRGLEAAHGAGVVHRDLKPANVFAVEEDGEPPHSRVLDFGIAKAIGGSSVPVAGTHTVAGQVVCTPEYASPELLNGTVSTAADIYALGHVFAELLDGRAPYDLGTHSLLIAGEHLKPEPVPLGQYSRNSGLQHIILRACAKPVDERYPNARAMLDDLRAVMPTLARGPAPLSLADPYYLGPPISRGSGLISPGASGPSATTNLDDVATGQFMRDTVQDADTGGASASSATLRRAAVVMIALTFALASVALMLVLRRTGSDTQTQAGAGDAAAATPPASAAPVDISVEQPPTTTPPAPLPAPLPAAEIPIPATRTATPESDQAATVPATTTTRPVGGREPQPEAQAAPAPRAPEPAATPEPAPSPSPDTRTTAQPQPAPARQQPSPTRVRPRREDTTNQPDAATAQETEPAPSPFGRARPIGN